MKKSLLGLVLFGMVGCSEGIPDHKIGYHEKNILKQEVIDNKEVITYKVGGIANAPAMKVAHSNGNLEVYYDDLGDGSLDQYILFSPEGDILKEYFNGFLREDYKTFDPRLDSLQSTYDNYLKNLDNNSI